MKLKLDWEKAALLSYDRNALIQFGVLQSYFEMEAWMDWLLKDRLAGAKGGVPFARKRDLLKKTLQLPSSVSRFLKEVERVKNGLSSHLPGTKRRPLPRYHGQPILDLATFKRFLSASRRSGDSLVRRLVKFGKSRITRPRLTFAAV